MPSAPKQKLAFFRPTLAEIDLGAFERNINAVRSTLPEGSRLIAVLKADAYGHGAAALAHVCAHSHVAMIAVALLEEALELHRAAIDLPILIMGPLSPPQIEMAAEYEFTIGVVGPEELETICNYSRLWRKPIRIHLKVDSGMGRMGLVESDLASAAQLLTHSPFVQLDAIYSHFANASDPNDEYTSLQHSQFHAMLAKLHELGVHAPVHHMSNSAATMRRLVDSGDYVRAGIALYGAEALDVGESRLEPVMRWTTRVARVKRVPRGSFIGYGRTFETRRDTVVATLPVGYADGYDRLLSNKGEVLLRGKRLPVIGRVSMDLITIDATSIPDLAIDEEVVLLGRQGEEEISAEELAEKTGTINYEILCNVSARVPRVYSDGMASSKFLE